MTETGNEILKEAQTVSQLDRIEYDGEVKMYIKNSDYPLKTAPTAEALWATNIVKKTVIEFILTQRSLLIFLVNKSYLQRLINSFVRIGYGVLEPYLYYKHLNQGKLNLTKAARGIGKMTELFLLNYGIKESFKVAELLAHIVEYDSFYRFKILDIMVMADYGKLKSNPRKEVQRLLKICYDREEVLTTYIRPKLKLLIWGSWILIWPPIRRAFVKTIEGLGENFFTIDDIDWYWMNLREDYYYFGQSPQERLEYLKENGYKVNVSTKI